MRRVFAIADLHLSLANPDKSMEVFPGWEYYVERLEAGWRETITEDDLVVIAGDLSWGLDLASALPDFAFLEQLPGKKLLMKGNHDYWWSTAAKMQEFFSLNGLQSFHLLHNNSWDAESFHICGTRGWMIEANAPADQKVSNREAMRLCCSLDCAGNDNREKVVFLHYPPVYGGSVSHNMVETMLQYGVRRCYYGHIHSKTARSYLVRKYEGVDLQLIAADSLNFTPLYIPTSDEYPQSI